MIATIMAGGKGSRMNTSDEKLLLKHTKPLILNVFEALKNSNKFSKIVALTSHNSPKTKRIIANHTEIFDTPGNNYAHDLNHFLLKNKEDILVVPGDLPLLDSEIISYIANQYDKKNTWTSIVITREFLESLNLKSEFFVNVSSQECVYTGISLINSRKIINQEKIIENYIIVNDKRIAFNLNTREDFDLLGAS